MEFNLVGQGDNFLHVSLQRGEAISSESNSMVMMEGNLDLDGEMRGGMMAALTRKFLTDESFFTQSIVATRGPGECLLAPVVFGDIHIIECGGSRQYYLNDGAFLASDKRVTIKGKMQNIAGAAFGGTGGFVIGQTSGAGKLAVSGFGAIYEMGIDTTSGNPVTIDNNHVVAWESHLDYKPSLNTNRSKGWLSSIINSQMSGEGIVLKFSGKGNVVICSRNKGDFVNWLGQQITPSK